jgi:hypothetical protein
MSKITPLACTNLGWLSKYKWRLDETTKIRIPVYGISATTKDRWLTLEPNGDLTYIRGYCWDGGSGPTWDTENVRYPSMGHDGPYQLIREGLIDKQYKYVIDMELERSLIAEGTNLIRARVWYLGVKYFGWTSL